MVQWLLENGSDANEMVSYTLTGKCTRLHVLSNFWFNSAADVENAIAIAKLLIDKGANILETDENRMLPMQLAMRKIPYGDFTEFLKDETYKIWMNLGANQKLKISKGFDIDLELIAENKELKKKLSEIEEKTKKIWNNSEENKMDFEVMTENQKLKIKLADLEERFKRMEEQIEKLTNKEKEKQKQ